MSLDSIKPIYFPSECNIDKELFVPVAYSSFQMDCMVGYFTSGSLVELASSLAIYLSSQDKDPLRLLISPNLSKEDLKAIQKGVSLDENLLPLLFKDFSINSETLANNTLKALCYLIATKKLILRIALKTKGIFHTKCWVFNTNHGQLAIHGSGNATENGLTNNFEQLTVNKEWGGSDSKLIVESLRLRFNRIWDNNYPDLTTINVNQKTIDYIEILQRDILNKERIIKGIIKDNDDNASEAPQVGAVTPQKIKLPHWLSYQTGDYSHQGQAVEAWLKNRYQGILSIATGGGKTITSLIAACLAQEKEQKPLFILIAVPTKALMNQWSKDVEV